MACDPAGFFLSLMKTKLNHPLMCYRICIIILIISSVPLSAQDLVQSFQEGSGPGYTTAAARRQR